MAAQEDRDKPQIVSDEDWKARVKAEDAALEQRLKDEAEKTATDAPPADDAVQKKPPEKSPAEKPVEAEEPNFPPASFYTLISMFSTQAMVALGVIANPLTEQAEVQLPLARHFIDLLGVLEGKTKGNLDSNEEALMTQTLHQLRIAFLEISKQKTAAEK